MKPLFYFLSFLFLTLSLTTKAQSGKQEEKPVSEISVIDLTSSEERSDGNIYIVKDKYYVAASFLSLTSKLKIDPAKNIAGVTVHQPESKKVSDIKKRLPAKYKNNIKSFLEISLHI